MCKIWLPIFLNITNLGCRPELHSGILAASLPSLRPLFRKLIENTSKRYKAGEHPNSKYGIRSYGL
ncbi:hypothetical protein BKA67DRAFT_556814 [Truncatella angustata]|uniref:Uncharacterized protein n=1 Tax=Truncatella angustata TaxID=152316 RepID=A0A9P8UTZ5_9PEZI|nr:uncharacterized protein BKA67DRAFT_556814 [Truncatella angustata]KAH6657960.1 hypothetical protein BKA67DRAFT_556814 [Truncatella angustata]